jgi:hypothetical protein
MNINPRVERMEKDYRVMVKLKGWTEYKPHGRFNLPYRYSLKDAQQAYRNISIALPTAKVKIKEV